MKPIFGVTICHHPRPSLFTTQLLQVHCSADTGQMTESLGSVAHLLAGNGHFFREHAQVV